MMCVDCIYASEDEFWGTMCVNKDSAEYWNGVTDSVGCELWEENDGTDIQSGGYDADNHYDSSDWFGDWS